MTRNQASGGESVSRPRSQVRRHSVADTARAIPAADAFARGPGGGPPGPRLPAGLATTDTGRSRSADYLCPCAHPLLERHAVVLAVPALSQRGLPELQRLEVRLGSVGVVRRAAALLDLVHDRAGLLVGRRLPEVQGLLG